MFGNFFCSVEKMMKCLLDCMFKYLINNLETKESSLLKEFHHYQRNQKILNMLFLSIILGLTSHFLTIELKDFLLQILS